jgi:hypothetical protein
MTDAEGNKADLAVCGYTLSGEDVSGDSAPSGEEYLNLLVAGFDEQSDRAAAFSMPIVYLAPAGENCAVIGDGYHQEDAESSGDMAAALAPPSDCILINRSLYSISPGQAPAAVPNPEAQPDLSNPGFEMFFSSTLVPASFDGSETLHVIKATINPGPQFSATEMAQATMGDGLLSEPLFPAA